MRFIGADGTERDTAEVFDVGPVAYDVSRAKAIIAAAPREPELVDLELAAMLIALGEVTVDPQRADRVDLTEPGIGVATPAGTVLIDGWHRALRTTLECRAEMAVYVLTGDEASQIRGYLPDRRNTCPTR